MKTFREIEKEYASYPGKTEVVKSLDDFLTYVEICINDLEEYLKDHEKEMKKISRDRFREKIRTFLFADYNQELDEIYDLDMHILKQCVDYTKEMGKVYRKIQNLATEENYKELVRLVDFSSDYYLSQTGYYDFERQQLDFEVKGITLYDPRYENNRIGFFIFIGRKLEELEDKHNQSHTTYVKKRENL